MGKKVDDIQKKLLADIEKSESFETHIFFEMARKLYDDCNTRCETLFDITMEKTNGFRNVTPEIILDDSRIIRVLRYCMIPVISQMKLGQLLGINTTKVFEDNFVTTKKQKEKLMQFAPKICNLVNDYMDKQRFLWLQTSLSKAEYDLAVKYAKKWTCSLIANQNSATDFRNWRKELQETSAVKEVVAAGYTSVPVRKMITSVNDILPGQYSRECRIKGNNTTQKADIVIRLKKSEKMLLIEAKAVGVKLDAFKRIKECRDKFDDWKATYGNAVEVGVVLSGFIPDKECITLLNTGAHIFWEYKEKDLYDFVCEK